MNPHHPSLTQNSFGLNPCGVIARESSTPEMLVLDSSLSQGMIVRSCRTEYRFLSAGIRSGVRTTATGKTGTRRGNILCPGRLEPHGSLSNEQALSGEAARDGVASSLGLPDLVVAGHGDRLAGAPGDLQEMAPVEGGVVEG